MKSLFSRLSKFNRLIALCVVGVSAFSSSAMADPIRDLQDEVTKRDISPEDVNREMRKRFPDSDFPYYAPVNGCSNPLYFNLKTFSWNGVFIDVCNNHDRCYSTPGKLKNFCDDEMVVGMLRKCESLPVSYEANRWMCQQGARVYYSALVGGVEKLLQSSQKAYDTAQSKQSSYVREVYDWLSTLKVTTFQTNGYIDTGISIRSGDRLRIRASGIIRFGLFAGSGGPNGIIIDPAYNYFVDVPHGRLMARFRQTGMGDLEGWSPIGVGWDQVREVELSAPGVLEFLVNDNEPGNNSGAFRIEVTIHSGKK